MKATKTLHGKLAGNFQAMPHGIMPIDVVYEYIPASAPQQKGSRDRKLWDNLMKGS